MNSLNPGVFTHTDGAPGLVSTSPLPVLPVPSFLSSFLPSFLPSFFLSFSLFLSFSRPVRPRSPSPPGSYFFFSAAVSDTPRSFARFSSAFFALLAVPFSFFSFSSPLLALLSIPFPRSPRALQVSAAPTSRRRKDGKEKARVGEGVETIVIGAIPDRRERLGRKEKKTGKIEAENRTLATKGPNNES